MSVLAQPLLSILRVFSLLATALSSLLNSHTSLQPENLALRHQIGVLQRAAPKRRKLTLSDRLLWITFSRIWTDWQSTLAIVKPETVIAWHREGFRLSWNWKSTRGRPGRPKIPKEVRELIRTMSRTNPHWGALCIHGELLKLGIEISQASVGKYMARQHKPPSQTAV